MAPLGGGLNNPFGMQKLFFGLIILPPILLIMGTVPDGAIESEFIIKMFYCFANFITSLILLSKIAKKSHNYDVESYNSLTTDQVVFTVIFTVISYSIINYFICELLVFVIT